MMYKSPHELVLSILIKGYQMIYVWLILGLFLLAWGGNVMVNGSVVLAQRLGVSSLLIGLTLVGFGTSTPELLTSLIAVYKNSPGIAVGNVVGSNIANILLVLGMAAFIVPVKIDVQAFKRDGAFLALATLGLIIALIVGKINFAMGVILTAMLIVYVSYSYYSDRKEQKRKKAKEDATQQDKVKTPLFWSLVKAVGGIALTILGAKLLVDNSIILARDWGVSEAVIGLTIVAVGTSLPELATSVASSFKGQSAVAFGNVVGSNIYNALFILGVTALFMPVVVPETMTPDVVLMTLITLILIGVAFWKKQFSRSVGFAFLCAYAGYTYYLYTLPGVS